MNVSHVIRKALCFDAVYWRMMCTMGVRIWHTLILMRILICITQVLSMMDPLFLHVYHVFKQFLFTGNIIQNLHSIINHPWVILHIKTLSLRICWALNAMVVIITILWWLLLYQHFWLLLLDILTTLPRRPCVSHGGLLTAIERFDTAVLVWKVLCHLSSSMYPLMPLLLDLLLALLQIILHLLLLRNIHVWSKRLALIFSLDLWILLGARDLSFSWNGAVCGLEWTIYARLGIRVYHVHLRILWLLIINFQISLLLMEWIKISAALEYCLWSDLLLLLKRYLMIKLLQKHLGIF